MCPHSHWQPHSYNNTARWLTNIFVFCGGMGAAQFHQLVGFETCVRLKVSATTLDPNFYSTTPTFGTILRTPGTIFASLVSLWKTSVGAIFYTLNISRTPSLYLGRILSLTPLHRLYVQFLTIISIDFSSLVIVGAFSTKSTVLWWMLGKSLVGALINTYLTLPYTTLTFIQNVTLLVVSSHIWFMATWPATKMLGYRSQRKD